ncbi:hypothetical protein VP01_807g15 [Puccinia sorghi]|uniref:Tet-like 2OG-Fe(II) oxygenase domain-containing protein n=1 Tax=Puccinia sorghi TaxID=27349 RepID=A0A0L6UCG1_9BASI|nr:hypothetical protein VP01_807g15 [Puccinia sorghi]
MAQFHPDKKLNSNIITGEMHMICFCPGGYRGKYAVSQNVYCWSYRINLLNGISAEREFNARIRYPQLYSFASNVSVTYNGCHNKSHQDKRDINGWTYCIFSYINKQTDKPIPSPSSDLGHGFLFPQHAYLIDFAKSNDIIEILWQTTEFEHQTTQETPFLQHRDENTWTHFGCSLQFIKLLLILQENLKVLNLNI